MRRPGFVPRTLCALALISVISAASAATAHASLVSWWQGEGNANDATGGNHGVLQGGIGFTPGVVGQAFSYDGIDDAVTATRGSNLNFGGGDFSISIWVKTTSAAAAPLFLNYAGINTYFMSLDALGQASLFFRDGGGDAVTVTGTTAVNDDAWHHVAAVRDGTTGRLYIDGELEATATNPLVDVVDTSLCSYVRIGASYTGLGNCETLAVTSAEPKYQGGLDEVQVYNHALSFSEIAAMNAVPVPGSVVLLVAGIGGLAAARLRRRV